MKDLIMKNSVKFISKKIILRITFLLLLYISLPFYIYAQKTEIKLDTNNILLGDQIQLIIGITLPENARVSFPTLADTLTKDIEIVKIGKIDTNALGNNTMRYSQNITITAFDSGYFVVPPLSFTYSFPPDTTSSYAETEAMLLEVKKVPINEQEDIKDLKDIFGAPLTFREILPYLLLGIGVIALVFLAIWLLKKYRKKEKIFFVKKPVLPPHIEALEALEKLKHKKLWQNNFVKEYYSELTDIIRLYLERAFEINALEMTTEEIKQALTPKHIDETLKVELKKVLELADLVKFAKFFPLPSEHESCFNKCVVFVNETTPKTVQQITERVSTDTLDNSSKTVSNNEKSEL